MKPQYNDDPIDLVDLLFALLRKWQYIVFSALCVGVITALVNIYVFVPMYTSTAKMYMLPKTSSIMSDLQLGSTLIEDYRAMIKSRPLIEEVAKNLNMNMSYGQLAGKISVSQAESSRMLNITVTDVDPQRAKQIVDEVANTSAKYFAEKMDQKPPSIIEYGYVNASPVSPNKRKNISMGILAGAAMASAVILFFHMMDDSIKNEEDIEKYLGMNTLAVVPEINKKQLTKKEKKRSKKKRGGK